MPARAAHTSQEGYPSSSPSFDAHSSDAFNTQARRYYDNDSDHVDHVEFGGRREPYDASHVGNEYENNMNYEYGAHTISLLIVPSFVSYFVHTLH